MPSEPLSQQSGNAMPPRRPAPMPAQDIQFWTPVRLARAAIRVLTMPVRRAAPAVAVASSANADEAA